MDDYRNFIKSSLAERCAKNPRYSLRAFALSTGISVSHLSRVMNGQKDLSVTAALKIATHLNLKPDRLRRFIELVSIEKIDPETRRILASRASQKEQVQRRQINLEMYEIISEWHYLPIYELLKSQSSRFNEAKVANKLGLPILQVKGALQKMCKLGLITKSRDGFYSANPNADIETSDDIQSQAIQKHHRAMSERAMQALEKPLTEREFQSLQILFRPSDISRAKAKIREFIDEFDREFRTEKSESVFQLNLQFFSHTKGETK